MILILLNLLFSFSGLLIILIESQDSLIKKVRSYILTKLSFLFFKKIPLVFNAICIIAFSLPDHPDTYWFVLLSGECSNYNFTLEFLTKISYESQNMDQIDWSILAQNQDLEYKVVRAIPWKDYYTFKIIEEGEWENWLKEVQETKDK